jgi:selenocysteine lyase/cysteine desulfurase
MSDTPGPSTHAAPVRAQLGSRALFPELSARAYLSHAGMSPLPSPALEAASEALHALAREGLGGGIAQRQAVQRVRTLAARLLSAEPDSIAFVQSTSAGVTAIARSIPFKKGERIILFTGEFPANVTPWQLVAKDLALDLTFVPIEPFMRSHAEGLTLLSKELERGARLVAVSAVQFQTGLAMPLEAMATLAHAHGAELFVDAIQGLGAVPLSVQQGELDYVVAGGHKFLMGLEGAGILYIRPRALEQLSLGLAGWTGHEEPFDFLIAGKGALRYDRPIVRRASFVEQGAISTVAYAALAASLELLLEVGVDSVFAHVNRYHDALEPELTALGLTSVRAREPAARSASLSLRMPARVPLERVAGALAAEGVAVSTPDGLLRLSPHFANSLAEVRLVRDAVARALKNAG